MTPSRFREELQRFDPNLDIEYNGRKARWEIVGYDLQGKRYLIKKIPLGQMTKLGLHTIQELYECSPIKQGGAKALNRRIDDLIAAEEAQEERETRQILEDRAKDAWVDFQYRRGHRLSFHVPETKEEIVITDKRRITA